MFKIEIVKFEAQDVITASGVATPACTADHTKGLNGDTFIFDGGLIPSKVICGVCGEEKNLG